MRQLLVALLGCSCLLACPTPVVTVDAGVPALDAGAPDASLPEGVLEVILFGVPANTPAGAALTVSGTFNGWDAGGAVLEADGTGAWVHRVAGLKSGDVVDFKFSRGSWDTVEKSETGAEVPNRHVVFDPAWPRVAGFVPRWADLPLPDSSRVGHLSVQSFALPQLGTTRNVWIYQPPGPPAPVPVLYALDAQNLFDRATATYGREWQLDEALEQLIRERRLRPMMVVAVESSANRTCEYNVFASDPHPQCSSGAAQGDLTVAFLADTLRAQIEATYPTLTGPANTGVLGSSMGGSVAMRAGVSRPDVFGRVAALSPSYQNQASSTASMPGWVASRGPLNLRVHEDVGTAEHFRDITAAIMLTNAHAVDTALGDAGVPAANHRMLEVPGAVHNEDAWALRVPDVLLWTWAP